MRLALANLLDDRLPVPFNNVEVLFGKPPFCDNLDNVVERVLLFLVQIRNEQDITSFVQKGARLESLVNNVHVIDIRNNQALLCRVLAFFPPYEGRCLELHPDLVEIGVRVTVEVVHEVVLLDCVSEGSAPLLRTRNTIDAYVLAKRRAHEQRGIFDD